MFAGLLNRIIRISVFAIALIPLSANTAPPELQTPAPVIYLADNMDEKDNLGWCIDTQGRGWSDQLQVHSCKPDGGDVQYSYSEETGQIESVEFPGNCASLREDAAAGVGFDLLDCSATSVRQKFIYNSKSLEFTPRSTTHLCIAAGAESRAAGPYMARELLLAACESTGTELKQWIIKDH